MCCAEKVFLEILQNSQENTCVIDEKRLWHSCEFCKISKKTVFYRAPPVAASVYSIVAKHYFLT